MKRWLVVAGVLAVSGCKKEQAPAVEQPAPDTAARAEQPSGGSEAPAEETGEAQAAAEEEQPVRATPELVTKYVAFQRVYAPRVAEAAKKLSNQAAKAQGDVEKNALGALATASNAIEAFETQTEAAQKEALRSAGLSEAELEVVREAASDVRAARMAFRLGGEGALEAMRQALAEAPPEQKPAVQAQIDQTQEGLFALRDAKDARERHGDAVVDALIAHEKELESLQALADSSPTQR